MNRKHIIFLLILLILIGTFLRFHNLGSESLWLDEAATALTVKKYTIKEIFYNTINVGQILPGYYSGNVDLPTYYVILKIWSNIFGLNEASLRSISAIFGSLSIILIYLLAKELFNSKVGLISAFIFSLNVVMIEYSQEARLYSFLIFIALLSAYFLIKAVNTNRNSYIAAFIISNLIGIYLHYPFIFFVIFEVVYVAYLIFIYFKKRKKIRIKKLHVSFLILFLAYLPLLGRILQPKLVETHYLGMFSFGKLIKIFLQLNTWLYTSVDFKYKLNNLQLYSFGLYDWLLLLSVALIVLFMLIFLIKSILNFRNKESLIFLVLWIIVVISVAFIVLYPSIVTFGSIRHFVFVVPAYIILASAGVATLKSKNLTILIVLLSAISMLPLSSYYLNVNNPQYREAASFLDKNIKSGDVVVVSLQSVRVPFAYYSEKLVDVYGISNVEEVRKITNDRSSVWLVLSTKYADPKRLIKEFFNQNYKLAETKSFYDVDLFYYVKK